MKSREIFVIKMNHHMERYGTDYPCAVFSMNPQVTLSKIASFHGKGQFSDENLFKDITDLAKLQQEFNAKKFGKECSITVLSIRPITDHIFHIKEGIMSPLTQQLEDKEVRFDELAELSGYRCKKKVKT